MGPPKPKRVFFRRTRELREKEWDIGVRRNFFHRLWRTGTRLERLREISVQKEIVTRLRPVVSEWAEGAKIPSIRLCEATVTGNHGLRDAITHAIAYAEAANTPLSSSLDLHEFNDRGNSIARIGKMTIEYTPATKEVHVGITFNTTYAERAYKRYFQEWKWSGTLGGGPSAPSEYELELRLSPLLATQIKEWEDAAYRERSLMEKYIEKYGRKPPKKKPLPKKR